MAGSAHLVDLEQHGVAIAVQSYRVDVLVCPDVAPLDPVLPRERE